jgi:hypothetical protein
MNTDESGVSLSWRNGVKERDRLSATHTRPEQLKRSDRVCAVGMVEEARSRFLGNNTKALLLVP